MNNCLSSNSETGGVGCDNMTMVIVGLLNGKSKKEWYELIGKRVADGDGPCAPPEYGKFCSSPRDQVFTNTSLAAEFRGPGVRHQFDNDSPDDYELDLDKRSRSFGGRRGRIILLGDGTEVLTDSDDAEMFDHSDEDKDTSPIEGLRNSRTQLTISGCVPEGKKDGGAGDYCNATPVHADSPDEQGQQKR